jgi:hypothetical protein
MFRPVRGFEENAGDKRNGFLKVPLAFIHSVSSGIFIIFRYNPNVAHFRRPFCASLKCPKSLLVIYDMNHNKKPYK